MIELKNVSKYYHSGDVTNLGLHNINLRFDKNEIVAICGESGCGKSTLLNVITKIDGFDEGEILFRGNETSYFSISDMDDFRKNKIGFIFQNYNIIDSYTVLENVMLPLTLKGENKLDAKRKALELIEKVGLSDRVKSRGTKLSGGEKQRVAIARALASDCEILACDEPTGNLDSKTGAEIIKLIKEVAKDKLVLIVTHNYDEVKDIVTRKITMADGEVRNDEVFTRVDADPDQELNLDYVPLSRRISAKIAKNNVVFTPRKTILLALIFMTICVSALFMFQGIYVNSIEDISHVYNNVEPNRIVLYDKKNAPIDEAKLSGLDYDINPFYEDSCLDLTVRFGDYGEYTNVGYSDRVPYTLVKGTMPKNKDEVIYVCSKDSFIYQTFKMNGYTGEIHTYDALGTTENLLTITGVGISDSSSRDFLTGSSYAKALVFNQIVANNSSMWDDGCSYKLDYIIKDNLDKPILYLPVDFKDRDIKVILFDLYDVSKVINIEYSDKYYSPTLFYSGNGMVNLPIYEASIYSNNTSQDIARLNVDSLSARLAKDVSDMTELSKLIANLSAYVFVFLSCMVLVIVYIITYVILSKVYSSKKKDYEILRTLGVTKRDMKHIVYFEVLSVSIVAIIVSYVGVFIALKCIPGEAGLMTLNLGTSLIYFGVTLLFAYYIGRRFNRRLFKFSVTKSMKGEHKHD